MMLCSWRFGFETNEWYACLFHESTDLYRSTLASTFAQTNLEKKLQTLAPESFTGKDAVCYVLMYMSQEPLHQLTLIQI